VPDEETDVWIQRVIRTGLDVERAFAELRAREDAFRAVVGEVEITEEPIRTAAMRALYWGCLTIRPAEIGKAFGIGAEELVRKAGPKASGMRCRLCGEEMVARSRAGLRAVTAGWQVQCTDCKRRAWEAAVLRDAREAEERERAKAARLAVLRSLPYAEYLKTPEWHEKRRAALRHAYYKCQLCGTRAAPLEVHHNCYAHLGCEPLGDLIVLCAECHARHHDGGG
jgi:hypothetical protein